MEFLLSTLIGCVVVCVLVRSWRRYKEFVNWNVLPLPPGTMGWPYCGETFKLYSQNPNVFFADKQKRYGDIFKTHILGCPCVMIASPEAAKFVLASQEHLFKPTFPASKEGILGPQALFFHQGDYHKHLRHLVKLSFLPDAIRQIVPAIEARALLALQSWEHKTVNTFHEMKRFSFDVAFVSIFGGHAVLEKDEIKQYYHTLENGYNSMPLNLPGTLFHKAMKARKELSKILSKIISERRSSSSSHEGLLQTLMRSSGQPLSDSQIADNIIGVIFAAHDTTASVLTWLLKYLTDDAELLEAVTAEQEAIQEEKGGDKGEEKQGYLTWADTKNMPLSSRVIQETLRMATILSFTFREAVQDVEYKGYLIPKGWKVMPLFRNIHHSPDNFPDPQMFDPSRFEVPLKPNTFLPFGNGAHSCPGRGLAKLEILILLHHLTTKYRWEVLGPDNGIQYGPFPVPMQGLPVKLSRKKIHCEKGLE